MPKEIYLEMDFVVVDTEGHPELSEIAIINSQGQVIYEAFSSDHPRNASNLPNLKSLENILFEFRALVENKTIVCHNFKYDREVLEFSFHKANLDFPDFKFECSLTKAKNHWTDLQSHSLEYLSKHLSLKVNNRHFASDLAHSAKYDAQFTYQLYRRILLDSLKSQINPFSSCRVDNPFQSHPDYPNIYQTEFNLLSSILSDIKTDINSQSQGAVVIGEPGSGKTHLMMRLAKARLNSNRLLFIRQPNNAKSVLHHIYSRVLESLVEKIGSFTQLDYLLISSYQKIIRDRQLTQKDQEILKAFESKNLELLGSEGTDRKRSYWERIENTLSSWCVKNYSAGGFVLSILKGIVKYCSYTEQNKKNIATRWLAGQSVSEEEAESINLPNWSENISLEDFSLEAITVLAKLSILDEPLIIIFDQLEGLGLPNNYDILLGFGAAIKEILTHVPNSLVILNMFPDRWQQFKNTFDNSIIGRIERHQIELVQPKAEELNSILKIKLKLVDASLEQIFSQEDIEDILEHSPIRTMLNRAADYYNYRVRHGKRPSSKAPETAVAALDKYVELEQKLQLQQQEYRQLLQSFREFAQKIQDSGLIDLKGIKAPVIARNSIEKITNDQAKIIEYLEQKKSDLEQQYLKISIISDADDIGKLKTIAEAFNQIKPIKLTHYRLGKRVLPEHIVIENAGKNYVLSFLQITSNGSSLTSRLNNFNELVNLHPKDKFYLFRDQRLNNISSKMGKVYLEAFDNSQNGKFKEFKKQDRVYLELYYQLITDIYNKDLDCDLETALNIFVTHTQWHYWLLQILGFSKPRIIKNT